MGIETWDKVGSLLIEVVLQHQSDIPMEAENQNKSIILLRCFSPRIQRNRDNKEPQTQNLFPTVSLLFVYCQSPLCVAIAPCRRKRRRRVKYTVRMWISSGEKFDESKRQSIHR